jgi:hypothetical protein
MKATRVALDFDGTLVRPFLRATTLRESDWRPGALAFVRAALAAGFEVVVHTVRASLRGAIGDSPQPGEAADFYAGGAVPPGTEETWRLYDEVRAFLRAHDLAVEVWTLPGKPWADVYVDDRAAPTIDWVVIAAELGLRLGHEPQGVRAVGGQQTAAPTAA